MDFDLEAVTPPSRPSRSLAWLGAASGLALALFLFGSPGTASSPEQTPTAAHLIVPTSTQDAITTASILPAPVVRGDLSTANSGQTLTLPESERHLLIILLSLCFMVMAAGGFALLKRGWQDLIQQEVNQKRPLK
jgi:hypothetical protein